MAAGANITLGMGDDLTNFGIGAKFQYNVTNPLRLEASFNYFFPKEADGFADLKYTMWDLNANAHWLFRVAKGVNLYPLAGIGVIGTKAKVKVEGRKGSASETDFAVNLGAGVDFKIARATLLNIEAKYKVGGEFDRFLLSAGVAFMF